MLKSYAGILLDEYTDGEILTVPKKRQALLIKAIYGMDDLDLSGMLEVLRHAERNAALLEAAATKLPDDDPLLQCIYGLDTLQPVRIFSISLLKLL